MKMNQVKNLVIAIILEDIGMLLKLLWFLKVEPIGLPLKHDRKKI
jgi:hypothetical protein